MCLCSSSRLPIMKHNDCWQLWMICVGTQIESAPSAGIECLDQTNGVLNRIYGDSQNRQKRPLHPYQIVFVTSLIVAKSVLGWQVRYLPCLSTASRIRNQKTPNKV